MLVGPDTKSPGQTESLRIATVLLAAGLSRRMGAQNKLLIEIGGEPMVRRLAQAYLAARTDVHVVVGYEAERVCEALKNLPLRIIQSPGFIEGQAASVRAGLQGLSGRYDAVLMALSDQPALTPADITGLLSAFGRSGRDRVLIPYHQGSRGNPVVFPPGIIQEILAAGPSADCRSFINANPQRTSRYEAGNAHFTTDIDTPDDIRAFKASSHGHQ